MPDTTADDASISKSGSDSPPARAFRVLVVDDEVAEETAREIRDTVGRDSGVHLEVQTEDSFEDARARLISEDFDVVVLDVMRQRKAGEPPSSEDMDAGTAALDLVKKTKFVPVIFYTARHMEVADRKAPPFVQVVSKDDIDQLPDAIRIAMRTGIQLVIRELRHFVDIEIRDFLWDQITEHPVAYDLPPEVNASVLAARIAEGIPDKVPALVRALAGNNALIAPKAGVGATGPTGRLVNGDGEADAIDEGISDGDPATRYLMPPVGGIKPGSILRNHPRSVPLPGESPHVSPVAGLPTWWVVLTPACDFAQDKVQLVLLGRAYPLDEFGLYVTYQKEHVGRAKVRSVLEGRNDRFVFLPAFLDVPNLVLDFQHVETTMLADAIQLNHVAELASPYGEALLNNHARYRGRIGTPDMPKPVLDAIVPNS